MRTPAIGMLALVVVLAAPGPGQAQVDENRNRDRGWLGIGAGAGRVDVAAAGASIRTAFMLDLAGGTWLSDRLGVGLRLGGWTIEGFDLWNPEEGESVSELFAQARFRPSADSPLSVSLESGWASYTVNDPERVLSEGDILGWRVGVQWELAELAGLTFAPSIVAAWGGASPAVADGASLDYRGVGLLIDLVWSW